MPANTTHGFPYPLPTEPVAQGAQAIQNLAAAVDPVTFRPAVTSLPASPVDGQIAYFLASATAGVIWQLRYRAASTSSWKWEFCGGGVFQSESLTDEAITSDGVYHDSPTPGPSLTVPLAGDYEVEFTFDAYTLGAASQSMGTVGLSVAAAAPFAYAQSLMGWSGTVGAGATGRAIALNVAAATVLKLVYKFPNGAAGHVRERKLAIRPVRVG